MQNEYLLKCYWNLKINFFNSLKKLIYKPIHLQFHVLQNFSYFQYH